MGCLLFLASWFVLLGCYVFPVCCSLCLVRWSLFKACCRSRSLLLYVCTVCYSSIVVGRLMFLVFCLLVPICCLSIVVCFVWFLLLAVCMLLLCAC